MKAKQNMSLKNLKILRKTTIKNLDIEEAEQPNDDNTRT